MSCLLGTHTALTATLADINVLSDLTVSDVLTFSPSAAVTGRDNLDKTLHELDVGAADVTLPARWLGVETVMTGVLGRCR